MKTEKVKETSSLLNILFLYFLHINRNYVLLLIFTYICIVITSVSPHTNSSNLAEAKLALYIYEIMKVTRSSGYDHNGFVVTHAVGTSGAQMQEFP